MTAKVKEEKKRNEERKRERERMKKVAKRMRNQIKHIEITQNVSYSSKTKEEEERDRREAGKRQRKETGRAERMAGVHPSSFFSLFPRVKKERKGEPIDVVRSYAWLC